jgi:hypothetical protein
MFWKKSCMGTNWQMQRQGLISGGLGDVDLKYAYYVVLSASLIGTS